MIELSLSNFAIYAAQVLIVVATAEACLRVTRLVEPRTRLAYWRTVIVVCFALPLVANTRPSEVQIPAQAIAATNTLSGVPASNLAPPHGLPLGELLVWMITLGIVLRALWLVIGLVRLRRLRAISAPVTLERTLETMRQELAPHAAIRSHESVPQPVTFGTWRPIVLVPREFDTASAEAQRAVVCHELLHVRRRDWLWMMCEEAIRTIFWFHPAMQWALNQVQLSREELVDALAIAVTGEKREYMNALLLFSGRPALAPAALFIRRNHLAVRIRRIAKEVHMSRLRLSAMGVVLSAALLAVIGAVVTTIPLRATAPIAQSPEPPSGFAARLEITLPGAKPQLTLIDGGMGTIRLDGVGTFGFVPLVRSKDLVGVRVFDMKDPATPLTEVDARVGGDTVQTQTSPSFGIRVLSVYTAVPRKTAGSEPLIAGHDVGEPLQIKRVEPEYPERARAAGIGGVLSLELLIGTDGSVVRVDPRVDGDLHALQLRTTEQSVRQAIDDLARAAADAVRQWQYVPTVVNGFPREVRLMTAVYFGTPPPPPPPPPPSAQSPARGVIGTVPGSTAPGQTPATAAPPPPPPPPPPQRSFSAIRIGGDLKGPELIVRVPPVYPAAALAARVAGVVILEVKIDPEGSVAEARVLRSIPLLDQGAIDAVKQWKYTPTLLNGVPVDVLMTVTVNFTLPQ